MTLTNPTASLLSRTPRLDAPSEELRKNLRHYFVSTWECYESLFETLNTDEAFYEKPISLRHPLIFYLGHTATFFINKLRLTRFPIERINEHFESVFAVGVDEMSWDDLDDKNYDWPSVKEVFAYRDAVKASVLKIIDEAPLESPIHWESDWWAIIMGIEHERIHIETSSVLIRQQKLKWVSKHKDWAAKLDSGVAPENELLPIKGGEVHWDKSWKIPIYGWDNEFGERKSKVKDFSASKFLVSNQEFLGFMKAGGYEKPVFWSEEGQNWLAFSKRQMPEFWRKGDGNYKLRLMTEEIPMPWNWPVEVNFLEAEAFCRWKSELTGQSIRLPSEDEWRRIYDLSEVDVRPEGPWNANIHLDHGASSCPVDRFKHGELFDVVGNVWQWTLTPIYPFDGFKVHPLYDDFTVPTYDGLHNLMKGGSWASTGNEAEASSRYAFRRHFFQHAGFRYVTGEAVSDKVPASHYETDELLSQYAEFHYGDSYFSVPNYPKALVELLLPYLEGGKTGRAMDLGCASGRASFELARYFDEVIGVDFSARFINQGVHLAQEGVLRYAIPREGELVDYHSRRLEDLGLGDLKRKPDFVQGDACNLKPTLKDFDLIFAANLIDRLYAPKSFLRMVHERLNPNGLLLLSSPYTWLTEHTPKALWLGGQKQNGEDLSTLASLKDILSPHFELVRAPQDLPFVIRETARKFQHSVAEVTLWKKRGE